MPLSIPRGAVSRDIEIVSVSGAKRDTTLFKNVLLTSWRHVGSAAFDVKIIFINLRITTQFWCQDLHEGPYKICKSTFHTVH